ncbi:MAG: NADH-quinone oxidoreductase subunit L [Limisphaerales bacterium]
MTAESLAWIALFAPLTSAVVIAFVTRRSAPLGAAVAGAGFLIAFVASCLAAWLYARLDVPAGEFVLSSIPWLSAGGLSVEVGVRLDRLSLPMMVVVTGVALMVQIYSRGYLAGDRDYSRYFASLSLFLFSMLGIVLSPNFVQTFIFWELVGVSSYLLIGFWFSRPAAADAAKKAFLVNRLGDFGFILGIIIVWAACGSVDFLDLERHLAKYPEALGSLACLAGLLVFLGAAGKSAQFPLHVWLPDAMEGPTPVSALIHAATMVAAGVYMLARVFFLFEVQPVWPAALAFLQGWTALDIIAWIGGLTALLAALMAVQQDDIKRILAYSTLSQLGFMVMAVGVAAPGAAMYHLVTHAFFKALLFLGAGAVIHSLHHEQNIWRMGGLGRAMPATYGTFLIGALALCGVPPLSGFYSKDAILAAAQAKPVLFILALFVATLTAFYMARLFLVAFAGQPRGEAAGHAQEVPGVMGWPLRILAALSVVAGLAGVEGLLVSATGGAGHGGHPAWHEVVLGPFNHAPLAALLGLFATVFGFALAWTLYRAAATDPLPGKLGALGRWMRDKFYFDELYAVLERLTQNLAAVVSDWFDRWILGGLVVRGGHGAVELAGRALRLVVTGNLQTYVFLAVGGLALVLWLALAGG